jgi:hypothetical protein
MTIISKHSKTALVIGSALIGMFALAGTAFAATTAPAHRGNFARPAVVGTVSAISGDTLTVTGKNWAQGSPSPTNSGQATQTTTTYTVDATNATVTKNNTASTVGAIAVGDTVMVQGSVSGSDVTATTIRDGAMGMSRSGGKGSRGTTTPSITGNGEPVVGGSVTAISGSTLTITNKSNVTYTIDASDATITKGNATTTIANIATGDTVLVQGTVNGTSVTASSVIDQGTGSNMPNNGSASTTPEHRGGGFFGAIGSFFTRIFGFF